MDLNKRDTVFYPQHGIARVSGIETINISDEEKKYYVFNFFMDDHTLKAPKGGEWEEAARVTVSADHLKERLEEMQEIAESEMEKEELDALGSSEVNDLLERVQYGDLGAAAEAAGALHPSYKANELSINQKELYDTALELLAGEARAVLSVRKQKTAYKEVEQYLENAEG